MPLSARLRERIGPLSQSVRSTSAELTQALRELADVRASRPDHAPAPPATGLVLDVGGGHDPHPRADVVVDKYLADDFERGGSLNLSKPVVIADAQALPFADGAFSYLVASHVLEHATDPRRFAAEFARVAPRGFVQVPSRESELTFGWPFHPWLIDREGDVLVFEPRDDRRAPVGRLFHDSYESSALFRLWWAATRSTWHHSIEWEGEIQVRVAGDSAADATATLDVERTVTELRVAADRGALQPLPPSLQRALRSPCCGGGLTLAGEQATCGQCGAAYPVIGGVPILLEEARQPAVA